MFNLNNIKLLTIKYNNLQDIEKKLKLKLN